MTVNELFNLYAAYKSGKTIMRKTEESHSGRYYLHRYERTEEVDFGELKLEDLMDVDEYDSDTETHDTATYTFFVKGEEPDNEETEECEDDDEAQPRPNNFGL